MFHLVNNLCCRLKTAAAWSALLTLGLFPLSSGCRCFSSHSNPVPATTVPTPQPSETLSDKTVVTVRPLPPSANSYRPPMASELAGTPKTQPEKVTVSRPVTPDTVIKREVLPSKMSSTVALTEKPVTEKPVSGITVANTAALEAENEALKRQNSELQKALAASKTEPSLIDKAITSPLPAVAELQPTVSQPKPPRRVPTFNEKGVTVSSKDDRIRIEVTDQTLFVPGTWNLTLEAESLLLKIAGEIRAGDPEASLEIEGHTDCLNTDPANSTQKHDIAMTKAGVVMEYFIKTLCWKAEKIRPGSFGSSRPVADNGTSEGRAKNNRVEIVVLPPQ